MQVKESKSRKSETFEHIMTSKLFLYNVNGIYLLYIYILEIRMYLLMGGVSVTLPHQK